MFRAPEPARQTGASAAKGGRRLSGRPCWNFAKGQCAFGDACAYVHDAVASDSRGPARSGSDETTSTSGIDGAVDEPRVPLRYFTHKSRAQLGADPGRSLLARVLERDGVFEPTRDVSSCHLFWGCASPTGPLLANLPHDAFVNHFPGTTAITHKHTLAMMLRRHPEGDAVAPRTFVLPAEANEFAAADDDDDCDERGAGWIVKRAVGGEGRGTIIARTAREALERTRGADGGDRRGSQHHATRWVAQRYVRDPLTFAPRAGADRRKIDLRAYALLTRWDPNDGTTRAYVHRDGLVRFAAAPWDPRDSSSLAVHLTNNAAATARTHEGGAEGGAEAIDPAPDSPAMPLRALLPDGSVDAVPTRRADDVAVSRATGTLGIATTSSTTRGREEASSSTTTTFVLRTRAAVVGVVLRAGADGVAAAGDGGAPPTLTLSTGDDVPAVSSADATVSSVTTWTLGAPRVGIGESRSNDDDDDDDDDNDNASAAPTTTQRRALRGGEVFAVVLAEPTPPCRVVRLTARNVSSGGGARGIDAGDVPLDLASARFVVRPTFPASLPSLVGSPNDEGSSDPALVSSIAADSADPTRASVARLSSRPEVARALEDSAPDHGIRSRTPVAFEEAHSNGSVLHVGLPPANRTVSGFRVFPPDPQPRAQPWVIRVYALAEEERQEERRQRRHGVSPGGDPLGSSLMGGPMSFEPPPLPKETPTHLGDFAVPTVRNRTPLCFDLEEEVDARVLIFESVAGEGRDTGWAAPAPSLSGRVQCYRLQ